MVVEEAVVGVTKVASVVRSSEEPEGICLWKPSRPTTCSQLRPGDGGSRWRVSAPHGARPASAVVSVHACPRTDARGGDMR